MDRLGAMRIFVSVAKLGSFTETARRLQLSPSVVTRSIAQLEAHMNGDLLVHWAWHPGHDAAGHPRSLPPVSQDSFNDLVHRWLASGARCPT